MLQLVNFDLGGKQIHKTLAKAVASLALNGSPDDCHNPPGGPWLLRTEHSVEEVLKAVDRKVASAQRGTKPPPTRRLLALALAEESGEDGGRRLLGAHRGLDDTAAWLAEQGFPLYDDGWHSPRVLAIDFGLHGNPPASDFRKLHTAIWHRFRGCCNPLHTLWFVHTSLPPEEVCRYLEPYLPNRDAKRPDGLLVFHAQGPVVETGLERVRADVGWLWENGVTVKVH